MGMDRIAVLIPCYNESQAITKVVQDFKKALPEADIYVYDNNSTDGTDKLAQAAGAIVRYEYRQGKGNVIRSMFRDIDADCYLMVDGDDTYPAEYASELCNLVLDGKADMVIGDRLSTTYYQENKRAFHGFGNSLVRHFINTFWGRKNKIVDVLTGYRAFSPLFVKTFPVMSQGFEIETEMTIHCLDKNMLIKAVPIAYRDRQAGSESKLNTYSDGIKVLYTIGRLYKNYKPLHFFGYLALFLALFAIILFIPVGKEYLETGLVPRFPTLIVSSVSMLAAFLSLVCGLILDTENQKYKQLLEIQMNIVKMLQKK